MQKTDMAQKLLDLKAREQKTRDNEIRIKAQQEAIQDQLKKARDSAIELYGTDDLAKLREAFRKAQEEDQRAITEYEEVLILREQLIDTITQNIDNLRLN